MRAEDEPGDEGSDEPVDELAAMGRVIGELCFGADWACAHGDLSALGHVARCLAEYAEEALRGELIAIAEACRSEPERATAAWVRLKPSVRARLGRPTD